MCHGLVGDGNIIFPALFMCYTDVDNTCIE